jgi:hypothetical protein
MRRALHGAFDMADMLTVNISPTWTDRGRLIASDRRPLRVMLNGERISTANSPRQDCS